jgi:hypothetical protein
MADEGKDPYPLEPHEEDSKKPFESPAERERRARIEAPGLLSDFEEDADFDRDPELERVVAGPKHVKEPDPPEDEREAFTKPGFGEARTWAVVGAVLLVSAMIATAINAPNRAVARVLLTLYNVLLHTGTGVVAAFVAAMLMERRLGTFELAAARMFTAVAAFSLLLNLHINLMGERFATMKLEELTLAALAYVLVIAVTFRLWAWQPLMYVIGAHFVLWLTVYVGMLLSGHVAAAGQTV